MSLTILHASSLDGNFLLWGERSAEDTLDAHGQRGRRQKVPRTALYPYDAGLEGLQSALRDLPIGITPSEKRISQVTAWLPTCAGKPIPSTLLVTEPLEAGMKIALAPWIIRALPLFLEETIELLCTCAGRQMVAQGAVVGKDLAFWTQVLRFAGALVARQQYLPGLEVFDRLYRACWEPVFTGSDTHYLACLAREMPPAARALSRGEATSPPETPAIEMLKQCMNRMVDYLVRSSVPKPLSADVPTHKRPDALRSLRQVGNKKTFTFDSVHDHWLYALTNDDGVIEGNEAQFSHLAAQIRQWRRPISIATASPFRLCFRLEEPDDKEPPVKSSSSSSKQGTWYVRFLLQAANDPSLLVPISDTWKPDGHKAAVLAQSDFNVHEYVLSSLGQAAGFCPRIESSLKTAQPQGYELDANGAHEFLAIKSMALEQAGFGVMLPAWWTRKGTKLHLTVRAHVRSPKMQGGSGLSLEQIVQFDWEVALGDEKLSLEELQALAKLKAPLVQVRGQWVEMSTEEIQAALDFWKKKEGSAATTREIIQMALGTDKTIHQIAFEGVKADGWVGRLLEQLLGSMALEEISTPIGFAGKLRPYQVRGYSWLSFLRQWGLGACLADDMGLGKTIQTLALIQHDWELNLLSSPLSPSPLLPTDKHQKVGKLPVLIVCPTSVVNNWWREAARFTQSLPVMVHHGIGRKKDVAFKKEARKHAIVISSYALLHRDLEYLQKVDWAGIVLDEAQNIKNPETKQARAARSLTTGYRIALTGTPVENNVGDLWSIMEFLNPGFLGTHTSFKRNFFIPIQAGRDTQAAQRLKKIASPFILRRLKTDKSIISDLPDKLEMKVFCTLTKEQASLYAAVLKDAEGALENSEGIQRKGVILATLTKLKQVCNHPAQLLGDNSRIPGRSGKLARLTEMLEEIIEVGDRALIFSQFSEMGELLRRHLQETFGREVLFLHGGVVKKQRDRMVERFQTDNDSPTVFILSLKAGGTGLNLTRANHVFHFDRWWNPAVENQATDRAFRIGQTKNVQVHKFLCAGTLEEKIDQMIERKKEVAEKVVGTGEGWLTKLSNEELKNIFALRAEAIGE